LTVSAVETVSAVDTVNAVDSQRSAQLLTVNCER